MSEAADGLTAVKDIATIQEAHIYFDTTKSDEQNILAVDEPTIWNVSKLAWRSEHLKTDFQRERWLANKFELDIEPHTVVGRRTILQTIQARTLAIENDPHTVNCRKFFTCCGMTYIYGRNASETAWFAFKIIYAGIWVNFISFHLQHTFVDQDDTPNQVAIAFGYACLTTLVVSFLVLFFWEGPRCARHHCPRYVCCRSGDCTGWQCCCQLRENDDRLRRLRYDAIIDPEVGTYQFDYSSDGDEVNPDIGDPDLYRYYKNNVSLLSSIKSSTSGPIKNKLNNKPFKGKRFVTTKNKNG